MDIDRVIKQREKWLEWKDIVPKREALKSIQPPSECSVEIDDYIKIYGKFNKEFIELVTKVAKMLKPWRKGPFKIGDLLIDSEWQSFIKYNLLQSYFSLKDKVVADVGCNNGYYMFRMLKDRPKKIVGFDPSVLNMIQFDFINTFIRSDIKYELLGIEHIRYYHMKFDIIFCLGVLYHRSDPIASLKSLKHSLNPSGEVILDTFMIDGDDEVSLTPYDRYSKIPNVYFIPTVNALKSWCSRAGFKEVEVLDITTTSIHEQRTTDWIEGESLNDFLDPYDSSKTIEGYPAPKRVYIRATI